ncbi:hypothetical protein AArcMg_2134 [Natrarchaeobaculum sulfurireducens]|uniref:Uncharacterized protein n=1 Tax=Natrarchaeobaculum sulfurireducens TaxID=2044521 RepID=A0A346PRI7_9EURY|nr:hypothetical protein AArcMg_2134 [Natrarchaeobaculum sulfurireducens]
MTTTASVSQQQTCTIYVSFALERDPHACNNKYLMTGLADTHDLVDRASRSGGTLLFGHQRHLQTAFQ